MISVREALRIIHTNKPESEIAKVKLPNALCHVIAENILAKSPSPPYTNSAMDGFAVKWPNVKGASNSNPVVLKIIGESRAGIPFTDEVKNRKAVHISTGAIMPKGTDTVIPIEDCDVAKSIVHVRAVKNKAMHVRYCGEEFRPGDLLIKKGTVLHSPQLAILASQGLAEIKIYVPTRIAIITAGSELVAYDQPLGESQLRDSNSIMLEAAILNSGGTVCSICRVKDQLEDTINAIQKALKEARIVILSGGVSVGPHDLVKKAAEQTGFETQFWKIQQKPGKPLFFARKNETLLFGLPGNPVSALMCFVYYIHPLLMALQGKEFIWHTLNAKLNREINNKGKRTQFIRVSLERGDNDSVCCNIVENQGSHMLTSISNADGFLVMEPGGTITKNQTAKINLFPWRICERIY
jgi:molybdopterin molybdotransferase